MVLDAACDRRDGKWAASSGPHRAEENARRADWRIRELAGCLLFGEKLVIHWAHEWRTVSEEFTETLDLIEGSPLRRTAQGPPDRRRGKHRVQRRRPECRFMNRSRIRAGVPARIHRHGRGAQRDRRAGARRCCRSSKRADGSAGVVAAQALRRGRGSWPRLRKRVLTGDTGAMAWLEWSADPATR